jgi:hypothetical protein
MTKRRVRAETPEALSPASFRLRALGTLHIDPCNLNIGIVKSWKGQIRDVIVVRAQGDRAAGFHALHGNV